jgi:hypothetical protein
MPALGEQQELRAEVIRAADQPDLYLVAVSCFDRLVLRRDLRRGALRHFAAETGWGPSELRRIAIWERLRGHTSGEALTRRGTVAAAAAAERLRALAVAGPGTLAA